MLVEDGRGFHWSLGQRDVGSECGKGGWQVLTACQLVMEIIKSGGQPMQVELVGR